MENAFGKLVCETFLGNFHVNFLHSMLLIVAFFFVLMLVSVECFCCVPGVLFGGSRPDEGML